MKNHFLSRVGIVAVLLALATGCTTSTTSYREQRAIGNSNQSGYSTEEPAGSIADMNRKLSRTEQKRLSRGEPKAGFSPIILLVAHDAEGKPLYVETRQSSGDPTLDHRAQDMVLKQQRFPKGEAETVMITVNPKSVPKK